MDAWIVIDLLEEMHFYENVRVYRKVGPVNIPVASIVTILNFPIKFLGHLHNHRVLSHWMKRNVLDTLMTIFFIVLNLSNRSTLGLRISTFSSSLSSSDYY